MLKGEHSAILSTFINLTFVIKIFVLSLFKWPFNIGFTVVSHRKVAHSDVQFYCDILCFPKDNLFSKNILAIP